MPKVTDMHIGLAVLVDESYKSDRTSPASTATSKKIGVVYNFNTRNETCDVIYSKIDDPSFSFVNAVKNLQDIQSVIEVELGKIADYHDKIEVLEKFFVQKEEKKEDEKKK